MLNGTNAHIHKYTIKTPDPSIAYFVPTAHTNNTDIIYMQPLYPMRNEVGRCISVALIFTSNKHNGVPVKQN